MEYNQDGPIAVYLNSSVLKDNPDYIINHVLAHEFAHGIERTLYKTKNRSHGKEWKDICEKISTGSCDMYVNDQIVVKEKLQSYFGFN